MQADECLVSRQVLCSAKGLRLQGRTQPQHCKATFVRLSSKEGKSELGILREAEEGLKETPLGRAYKLLLPPALKELTRQLLQRCRGEAKSARAAEEVTCSGCGQEQLDLPAPQPLFCKSPVSLSINVNV